MEWREDLDITNGSVSVGENIHELDIKLTSELQEK